MEQPAEDSPELPAVTARGSARTSLIAGGLGAGVSVLPPLMMVAGTLAHLTWPASSYLTSAFSVAVLLMVVLGATAVIAGVSGLDLERRTGVCDWRSECIAGLLLGLLVLFAGCFLSLMIWYWLTGDYKP